MIRASRSVRIRRSFCILAERCVARREAQRAHRRAARGGSRRQRTLLFLVASDALVEILALLTQLLDARHQLVVVVLQRRARLRHRTAQPSLRPNSVELARQKRDPRNGRRISALIAISAISAASRVPRSRNAGWLLHSHVRGSTRGPPECVLQLASRSNEMNPRDRRAALRRLAHLHGCVENRRENSPRVAQV